MQRYEAASPPDDPAVAKIQNAVIGNRITIKQTAKGLGKSERAIYSALERNPQPYIVVLAERYYEPQDMARALVSERNTEKRGRGRPRKHAA